MSSTKIYNVFLPFNHINELDDARSRSGWDRYNFLITTPQRPCKEGKVYVEKREIGWNK